MVPRNILCCRWQGLLWNGIRPSSLTPTRGNSTHHDGSAHQQRGGHKRNGRLSYVHNPGSEPLMMATLGQLMDEAAEKWPDKAAIISFYEKKKMTFREVKDQAEQLGAGLLKLGLRPGDRLALLGVNSLHWFLVMAAAAKVGIITAMMNPGCTSQELGHALKMVRSKAIVTDRKFRTQDYAGMLARLMPQMTTAPHGRPLSSPQLPDLEFALVVGEEKLPGCYRLGDVLSLATTKGQLEDFKGRVQPEDPISILFSSGTTGIAKGTVLSHFSVINNAHITGKMVSLPTKEDLTLCNQLPFFHIYGTGVGIVLPFVFGCTSILPGPLFSKELALAALQHFKVDILSGTPTMHIDLVNEIKKSNSPQIRQGCANVGLVASGGAHLPDDLVKHILEVFPRARLCNGYGMTELSGGCTSGTFLKSDSMDRSGETLFEHAEVKIVDDNGRVVPVGTLGEAWFRSPYSMLSYWGDRAKTNEAKEDSGWLKSGDLMKLRDDGTLEIVGRKKDLVIRGGENIFPAEVEDCLLQHPEVVIAEVYGVADKRMGEEVAVSIKLKPHSTLDKSAIQEFCKGKISHFKIPKHVRFVDVFPMTGAGKVMKYVLRAEHEKELEN